VVGIVIKKSVSLKNAGPEFTARRLAADPGPNVHSIYNANYGTVVIK
jgi:hypothetical protein